MTPTYLDKQEAGEYGNITVPAGTQVDGIFCKLQCIGETTFTTLTDALEGSSLLHGGYAAGTITVSSGALTAGDYIEIGNGTDANIKLTAVAENATPTAVQFKIGTSVATAAANILAAINANEDISALVVASAGAAGVVVVTSIVRGSGGDAYHLVKSGTNLAVSGAHLTGGALAAASSVTYPDGSVLVGRFTTVKPATGKVRLTLAG